MPSEVVMPRLGWTMETGRVVEWLKQDGEEVRAGEFLFLVETEKAVTEVEALDSGVLRIPPGAPEVGEDVDVGAMLAWIVAPDEAVPFERADAGGGSAAPMPVRNQQLVPPDAAVPRIAATAELTLEIAGARAVRSEMPAISPRARRAAAALGVDWTVIAGSGDGGRIRERDVLAAAR